MSAVWAALLIAALLAFVVWLLSGPFRARRTAPADAAVATDMRRALESARDAKLAEIRDNETDYRTGKLSAQDFRELDRALRAEAAEILRAIDERTGGAGDSGERRRRAR